MIILPSNIKLHNIGTRHQPRYEVRRNGEVIGQVARTGSLPSMYHWWAYDVHGVQCGASSRTRSDAVEKLAASIDTGSR